MAEPSEEFRPEAEDDEGGAVKSFLEHLEDLRWMLIKSFAAVLLCMIVCLFGVKYITAILTWPLERAKHRNLVFMPPDTNQLLHIHIGGYSLPQIDLKTNRLGSIDLGTNRQVTLQLEPIVVGSNTLMSVREIPEDPNEPGSGPQLYYMGPADSFMSIMYLAFFGGLFMACPLVFYFIGQFIMPALRKIEKKYFMPAFWIGLLLFLGGASFAYFVVMPPAIKFAELASNVLGISSNIWKAEEFFSFEVKFMVGMGAGFELPVVLLALVKIGLLDYGKLTAMRRYMIVGNLILGALLTTPEPFTQVIMAIVLQALFELAVWVAWYWERQEKKRKAAAGEIDV